MHECFNVWMNRWIKSSLLIHKNCSEITLNEAWKVISGYVNG